MQQPSPTRESTATEPLPPQPPVGVPHGLAVGRTFYLRGGFGLEGGVYRAITETTLERLPINRKERRRRMKLGRAGR